jgi:hypothetical protein
MGDRIFTICTQKWDLYPPVMDIFIYCRGRYFPLLVIRIPLVRCKKWWNLFKVRIGGPVQTRSKIYDELKRNQLMKKLCEESYIREQSNMEEMK